MDAPETGQTMVALGSADTGSAVAAPVCIAFVVVSADSVAFAFV